MLWEHTGIPQETFDKSVWTPEQILNKSLGNQLGAIGNLSGGHGEVLKTSIGDPQHIFKKSARGPLGCP